MRRWEGDMSNGCRLCWMFRVEFSSNNIIVPILLGIPLMLVTVFLGPRKRLAACADDGFDRSVDAYYKALGLLSSHCQLLRERERGKLQADSDWMLNASKKSSMYRHKSS